jgi:hypothetical protein
MTTPNPKASIPVPELAAAALWEWWVGPDDEFAEKANITYDDTPYVFLRFEGGVVMVFDEIEWRVFLSGVARDRELQRDNA